MASAYLESIEGILNKKFIVKTYQRGYRWDKTEIEELLTDLDKFQSGGGNNIYCLQPIVVKKDGDEYELVDGQQRLTALWLIKKYHQVLFGNLGEAYSLRYEGKEQFTQLLKDIDNLCSDSSKNVTDLLELVEKHSSDSIDSYMLSNSVNVMKNYKVSDTKLITAVLSEILGKLKYVGVIWYELDCDEDPISFFTNLNANKVPLTDAELIKASLYHYYDDSNEKETMINEWQEIEKKLHEEELWHFLTYDANKAVRIEYLFEIWCCVNDLSFDSEEKNPVFHSVNSFLSLGRIRVSALWKQIKGIFEALCDWKSGYDTYHIIGFLTLSEGASERERRKNNIRLIKELYVFFSEHKKSEFKTELKRRVRECFIGPKLLSNVIDKDKIGDGIKDLSYSESRDKGMIKRVLWFHNVALLLEANNQYERFPFKALKKYKYDIEHINPQSPQTQSAELVGERKKWLEDHKNYSNLSESLEKRIDDFLSQGAGNFNDISGDIRKELELDEHFIGNLVLLDRSLNSSYSNECFVEKRSRIVSKLRSNGDDDDEKKPILPGTKWVFLKEYDNVITNTIWTKSDIDTYTEDLSEKLFNYLR